MSGSISSRRLHKVTSGKFRFFADGDSRNSGSALTPNWKPRRIDLAFVETAHRPNQDFPGNIGQSGTALSAKSAQCQPASRSVANESALGGVGSVDLLASHLDILRKKYPFGACRSASVPFAANCPEDGWADCCSPATSTRKSSLSSLADSSRILRRPMLNGLFRHWK